MHKKNGETDVASTGTEKCLWLYHHGAMFSLNERDCEWYSCVTGMMLQVTAKRNNEKYCPEQGKKKLKSEARQSL